MNNKKLYIIVIIVVAAVLAWWWWSSRQAEVEAPLETSDINQELEGLDVNNLDAEFQQIDQDLNAL